MTSPLEQIPVRTIQGDPASLADYSGKVRLVVNVASKCGLTPQYRALQALYGRYQEQGFEILGFPCNDFSGQEPGSESEIQEFCSNEYDVTFPLFSKISVKGSAKHALYDALIAARPEAQRVPGSDFRAKLVAYGIDPGAPDDVLWNFEKFLISRRGEVVERFAPDVPPDSELITSAIERELQAR